MARNTDPGDDSVLSFPSLAGFTAAQVDAVLAEDRVLCILAGAGAGKTRVLTHRIARRLADGSAEAPHVLAVTFSRKAADELRRRLWLLHAPSGLEAGTFHRTALRLLRNHALDRSRPLPVVLADRPALVAEALGADSGGRAAPSVGQLEVEIGWAKARLVAPDAYPDAAQDAGRRPALGIVRMAEAYERYESLRLRRGVLDLDDLLVGAALVLENDAAYRAAVHWRHRHLFVDEMQDVNPAQFRLLVALGGDDPDICVVGDPHQSVYGWNGADPTLLDRLPALLPAVRLLRLDENHRCTPQVVAVAGAVLTAAVGGGPLVSTRHDGSIPKVSSHLTDADEASWVASEVRRGRRPGMRWSRVGVLARTNAQLGAVESALQAARVPCRRAGGDLGPASDLSAPEVTDRVAPVVPDPAEPAASPTADTDDAVVLSTFHRAKGLQWSSVYVIGLSDGSVPIRHARTPDALAEEARLLYVALTRAEDDLSCSWAEFPDRVALERGSAPRDPSPWLRAIESACASLAAGARPPDPGALSARIAELRARL